MKYICITVIKAIPMNIAIIIHSITDTSQIKKWGQGCKTVVNHLIYICEVRTSLHSKRKYDSIISHTKEVGAYKSGSREIV